MTDLADPLAARSTCALGCTGLQKPPCLLGKCAVLRTHSAVMSPHRAFLRLHPLSRVLRHVSMAVQVTTTTCNLSLQDAATEAGEVRLAPQVNAYAADGSVSKSGDAGELSTDTLGIWRSLSMLRPSRCPHTLVHGTECQDTTH